MRAGAGHRRVGVGVGRRGPVRREVRGRPGKRADIDFEGHVNIKKRGEKGGD